MSYQFLKERTESSFAAKKPLMSKNEAIVESSRCIRCYDAPCIQGCPTSINIPQFIKRIEDKSFLGAADSILQSNILGLSCSKVCPVEVLCEGACVYNNMDEPPIQIGRLQEYALHHFYQNPNLKKPDLSQDSKVALIGAGPASLSCAAYLALSGVKAVIFEKEELPGGLNSLGVAPYKLKLEESLKEVEFIQSLGVEIITNKTIGKDLSSEELRKEYSAIFIGAGLAEDNILLDAAKLKNCFGAVEKIRQIKLQFSDEYKSSIKALVIGGGNTALDLVQELAELGVKVTLAYRKTSSQMSGYKHELKQGLLKGINFLTGYSPKKVLSEQGVVSGVEFDTNKGVKQEQCDWLFFATGQHKQPLQEIFKGLELNSDGTVKVNEKFETSLTKIYAGGDCINGGKEVVNAVCDGREAAKNILKQLNKEVKYGRFIN